MKHLVGKKVVVSVPFLGETVEVVKLSVNQIEAFQASVKALQDSKDEKSGLKIQNDLVEQMGASDLAELVDTYGQDYVDESVGLLRVEDFIISNANVSEKVALGDAVGEDATVRPCRACRSRAACGRRR